MDRKSFLKSLSIFAATPFVLSSYRKSDSANSATSTDSSSTNTDGTTADSSCTVTPTETEGPFPTKTPSSYIKSDIRKGDGTGADTAAVLTITNLSNNGNCLDLNKSSIDSLHHLSEIPIRKRKLYFFFYK